MTLLIRTSLLSVLVAMAPAWSAAGDEGQYGRLPESVQRVERETGGKVLQVKSIQRGDREIYRMKVLTPDGRIRVVHDDPRHPRGLDDDIVDPEQMHDGANDDNETTSPPMAVEQDEDEQ